MQTLTYHAIRGTGDGRIEEIRVTRPKGGTFQDMREEHVAYHPDKETAQAAMKKANGFGF
jgi:hypothetical protein